MPEEEIEATEPVTADTPEVSNEVETQEPGESHVVTVDGLSLIHI